MHAPVRAFFLEERMRGEGMLVAVLKDKIAAGMKDILREHLVRQGLKTFKSIRRISEYDVELLMADIQEVTADQQR